jgi:multiple sugar transport system permease protein
VRGYRAGLWWLLVPWLVGTLLLVVGPALVTAGFAFTRYDALSPPEFAGLAVFFDLFGYTEFRRALVSTVVIVALAVPLRVGGGLALALYLHRRRRLTTTARVAAYAPSVVPDVATALVWLWVVNPVYGPIGLIASAFGAGIGPVMLDPTGARLAVVAISAFALGEGFLVTLAARRELPEALYDVARTEGAGPFSQFRLVTLPLLAPVLGLLTARDLVVSLQVILVPTLLLTRGGPLGATKTLPLLAYERGFRELELGDGAAIALLLTLMTGLVVALQFRLLRRWTRAVAVPAGGG